MVLTTIRGNGTGWRAVQVWFEARVERWEARLEEWCLITVPAVIGADIAALPRPRRGFGAVRVRVTIGRTTWQTSVFPGAAVEDGQEYVLPLKRAVRDAEDLREGSSCAILLETIDI